jgi:hypothetical protein
MKLPVKLRLNALGVELVGEIDVPDELLGRASAAPLNDEQLRARWGCSKRTLARHRASRRLAFFEPAARHYMYELADVESFELKRRRKART